MKANLFTQVALLALMIACNNGGQSNNSSPAPKPKESGSGFSPTLGTEIVVHQWFEQKYACDGKVSSETKGYVHEGYPDLKINPKRNIAIDRATFTNMTTNNIAGSKVFSVQFGKDDSKKHFRVYIEPRRDLDPGGRHAGPPLLEVVRGENHVHYKYESCQKWEPPTDDPKGTPECKQWYPEEEGEVLVTVGITERTETPEICRKYPKCGSWGRVTSYGECNQVPQ